MKEFLADFITTKQCDYCLRLLLGFACGAILGFERKRRHHEIGIRTLALLSLISSLLSIVSLELANQGINRGDPTRIAAGVITGIGFIGGGAILRQGLNIRGLTSSAIVFCSSGLGLACGAGLYKLTIFALLVIVISLTFIEKVERRHFPTEKAKTITIKIDGEVESESTIFQILMNNGVIVYDTNIEYNCKKNQTIVSYSVKAPDYSDIVNLTHKFAKMDKVLAFAITNK